MLVLVEIFLQMVQTIIDLSFILIHTNLVELHFWGKYYQRPKKNWSCVH